MFYQKVMLDTSAVLNATEKKDGGQAMIEVKNQQAPLVSFYRNFNDSGSNMVLEEILLKIKNGDYKKIVERIRSYEKAGEREKKDSLKRGLPAFTPSATFSGGRKIKFLQQYSGIVHLDFDKIPIENLDELSLKVNDIPYTYASFRSPSGNGFKVFILISSGVDQHPDAYKLAQVFYESILGIESDPKCKDITRLCFVSHDPATYINSESQIFHFQPEEPPFFEGTEIPEKNKFRVAFQSCISFTEKKEQYLNGNRNSFIYLLASNCNRVGIPEMEAIPLIKEAYDLPLKELEAAVNSAYKNHEHEFAQFANFANLQSGVQEDEESDYLRQTPFFPDNIFEKLPAFLASGCSAFIDKRERDVFLTGAFSIISGCMPNVSGVYAQQTVYPNLYCFIIAPAASGKGSLKFAKMLADKEHDILLQISREAEKKYQAELNEYRNKLRFRKKTDDLGEPPLQPQFKVLYIPANASYAKILWHLEQNLGEGTICETEADTMGNAFKQEWGSYSDMLRKGFHHERLSSSKKSNNEYIEINNPRISIALSGTPSQIFGLIGSSEDGLFSRFIFYAFKAEPIWRDVSTYSQNINLTDHFGQLSNQVVDLIKFLKQYHTHFELSRSQWNSLNNTCAAWLQKTTIFNGNESGSIVKRLGIILFRIAMIFTALRKFENGDTSVSVTCTDDDFETALQMSQLYLEHSIFMFSNLRKHDQPDIFRGGSNKQQFFDDLPRQFKRSEAIALGKKRGFSERTVDNLLKKLLGKYLKQESFGTYSKI